MIYRDDDISYLTNKDEFAAFHDIFVRHLIPHTLAMECDQMDRNHAVNNYIKSGRIFDIQVHGWTHRDYGRCSEDETYNDLMRCIEFITWKFGRRPKFFYPPWNIDSQPARRAAARAGLLFRNNRVEARDYLAGGIESTVNLHYWQDLDILDAILTKETSQYSPARREFHRLMWNLEPACLPQGGRVLFVGKTHVYDYDRYLPACEFSTLDIDPQVHPTYTGDIHSPPSMGGQFDVVIMFGVYELLSNPSLAIAQAEALVKDGGYLIVGAPLQPVPYGPQFYAGDPDHLSSLDVCAVRWIDNRYAIGTYKKA